MWGLSSYENISTPYKLFKQAANGVAGPLNSFQVYFRILGVIPNGANLLLRLDTSASGAVEHSIITNLPAKVSASGSKMLCKFDAESSFI